MSALLQPLELLLGITAAAGSIALADRSNLIGNATDVADDIGDNAPGLAAGS